MVFIQRTSFLYCPVNPIEPGCFASGARLGRRSAEKRRVRRNSDQLLQHPNSEPPTIDGRPRNSLRLRQLLFFLYTPSPGNRLKYQTYTHRRVTIQSSHPHFFRNLVHRHIKRIRRNRSIPWSNLFGTEATLRARQENRVCMSSRSIKSFV